MNIPMFDHLEPNLIRSHKVSPHHHVSLSIMMASCLALAAAFVVPILSYTQPVRANDVVSVKLWADEADHRSREVVGPIDNLELGHFILKNDGPITIDRLRLTIDGLYQPVDLSGLHFYLDNVQVGRDRPLDGQGTVTFEDKGSSIAPGTHDIVIRTNWLVSRRGQLVSLRINSADDVSISSKTKSQSVDAIFPLAAPALSFIEQGSWIMVQAKTPQSISADDDHNLQTITASIPLAVRGEALDLKKLVWEIQTTDFIPNSLTLLHDQDVLQTWKNISGKSNIYSWSPTDSFLAITPEETTVLKLRLTGQAIRDKAAVKIITQEVQGSGNTSGLAINWQQQSGLEQIYYLVNDQPYWTLIPNVENSSYALHLQTVSGQPITIDSLVLQLDSDIAPSLSQWKVLVNGLSIPRAITRSASNYLHLRFSPSLKLNSGDTLEFKPTANDVSGQHSGTIHLSSDEFTWFPQSTKWFAVTSSLLPTAPAALIKF